MADIETSTDNINRCQAVLSKGQCINKQAPGSEYCMAHGGNIGAQREAKQETRNYMLAKWQNKFKDKTSAPGLKSLRDEIGIMRMLLEERLLACHDSNDLILASAPISELLMKVEKLVVSCHKLERSMGELLDKTSMLQFASSVVEIISQHVDPERVNTISDDIIKLLGDDV